MASNNSKLKNLFHVCWQGGGLDQKLFFNFISDPREDNTIKLPQRMIEQQMNPPNLHHNDKMSMIARMAVLERSINGCLKACYAGKMPKIHLTEDGADFALDIHVHESHSEALLRQPPEIMRHFLYTTLEAVQEQVMQVAGGLKLTKRRGQIELDKLQLGQRMATGRRARRCDITCLLLTLPTGQAFEIQQARQLAGSSISADRFVLSSRATDTDTDTDTKRSVHYNITPSRHTESIRLSSLMLVVSGLPKLTATYFVESREPESIKRHVRAQIARFLDGYYKHRRLNVCVAGGNNELLVVIVPFHVDHAPKLKECLEGELGCALFEGIANYYQDHLLCDWHSHGAIQHSNQIGFVRSGRPATRDEIYSLLLANMSD